MTGPRADWPGPVAPTDQQVGQVRDRIRARSLGTMWAELRHEYADRWGLAVVATGVGSPLFGDHIEATRERATETATARLELAGYQVRGWSETTGGWNGDLS